MRIHTTTRVGALALSLALVAAGCGANRADEDPGATGDSKNEAGSEVTKFGDLASPCGAGDAKGATDQGVTDESITIGFGDDRGFAASPGLGREVGDAAKAMIAWCNEQGGINGRKIVGNQYDAALSNAPAVVQESCTKDFMMVAHGFALDEAAEQFRVGCDLPSVPAYTIGPNASMGPLKYEPMPFPADYYNSSWLKLALEEIPEFKKGPTPIGSDSMPVTVSTAKIMAALGQFGVKPNDCGIKLSSQGEASYAPFAQKLKDCGATAVWSSNGPIPGSFGLIEAMDRAGVDIPYVGESQWYGNVASEYNAKSGLLDGLTTGLYVQPLENSDVVPAVKQYQDLVLADKGKTSPVGMSAASAFLLWATAVKTCGSDLTRDCVMEEISNVHEWTGGGLHASSDPGGNMPSECGLLVQLKGSEWKQIAPASAGEFSCDPANVVEIDPGLSGVKLNEDRISTAFLKQ